MLSLIETPETLAQLSVRLAAWCVVEADGQRFNFRFPDTRRLPAIFQTLDATQRAQFAGHVKCWSYVGREGRWVALNVAGANAEAAGGPVLGDSQFAALVDDSRPDELLMVLSDRGFDMRGRPSLNHARIAVALRAAFSAALANEDLVAWCAWFWQHAESYQDCAAPEAFHLWRNSSIKES